MRVTASASALRFFSYFLFSRDTDVHRILTLAVLHVYFSTDTDVQRKMAIMEQLEGLDRATVIGPGDGRLGFLGTIGVRFMIDGGQTGEGFALVEHPMAPRALAAPLHRHNREDEYSFVLEGRMGALLGEDVVEAGPGTLVFKPRGQWHTFWNAADVPTRILEIIAPAGFERFFKELSDMGGVTQVSPGELERLCAAYELEMDPGSVQMLLERFNLRFPAEPVC